MTSDRPVFDPGVSISGTLGVYVHVPFCQRRCPYCDFSIAVRPEIPHQAYLRAVLAELEARAPAYDGLPLTSLYFGGGTPSLWASDALAAVIDAVRGRWGTPGEVTVEVNPGDVDRARLDAWRAAGVNRLSVGAQSFDPALLRALGRSHSVEETRALLRDAQHSGFERISLDLIFGVAGQRRSGFERDLNAALDAGVEQVSTYSLTIEPHTPFARREARGERLVVEDDEVAEMFEVADQVTAARGLRRYEPSNIARPGHWSRHNLIYWLGGVYLGLGMGAHSLWRSPEGAARRRGNSPDLKRYLADPLTTPALDERLAPEVHLSERIFLGLRTRFPLSLEALAEQHGAAQVDRYRPALDQLVADGLIEASPDGRVATTARGLLFHDRIAARVVERAP